MATIKIELADGKYTYVRHDDGRQHALRYGEIWRDLVGDKFICSLAQHAEDLRVKNEQQLERIETLEKLRPHWAQGYTDDGVAAQVNTSALSAVWEVLGVSDQTAAMAKLREVASLNAQMAKALKLVQEHAPVDGLHIGNEQYLDDIVAEALTAAGVGQ